MSEFKVGDVVVVKEGDDKRYFKGASMLDGNKPLTIKHIYNELVSFEGEDDPSNEGLHLLDRFELYKETEKMNDELKIVPKFKVGDKVILDMECLVNMRDPGPYLKENTIYEIIDARISGYNSTQKYYVKVKGMDQGWFQERFKLAPIVKPEEITKTANYITNILKNAFSRSNTMQPVCKTSIGDTVKYVGETEHFKGMTGVIKFLVQKRIRTKTDFILMLHAKIQWDGHKHLSSLVPMSELELVKSAPVKPQRGPDYYRYMPMKSGPSIFDLLD